MSQLLRPLLIRLLLLAVFFNTVVGIPAHEAEHLRQATVAGTALAAPLASEVAELSEQNDEVHSACAWCLAHAQLGIAPALLPATAALAWQSVLPRQRAPETFVAGPGRWPFASRDPPPAVS